MTDPQRPAMVSGTSDDVQRRFGMTASEANGLTTGSVTDERHDLAFYLAASRTLDRVDSAPRTAPCRRSVLDSLRSNYAFFLSTLLILYFGWCLWDRFLGPLPTSVRHVQVLNPVVDQDSSLRVRFRIMRRRVCERDFEWLLQDSEGTRFRRREAHMHAIGNAGPDSFIQDFEIPDKMKPGPATLRIIWSWSCPENLYELLFPVTLIPPNIDFTVTPAPPILHPSNGIAPPASQP